MATAKAAEHASNNQDTCTRMILTDLLSNKMDRHLPHALRVTGPDGVHRLVSPNDMWSRANSLEESGCMYQTGLVPSDLGSCVGGFMLDLAPDCAVPVSVIIIKKPPAVLALDAPSVLLFIQNAPLARAEAEMFECPQRTNMSPTSAPVDPLSFENGMTALRTDAYTRLRVQNDTEMCPFQTIDDPQYHYYRSGISPFMQLRTPTDDEQHLVASAVVTDCPGDTLATFVCDSMQCDRAIGFHTLFVHNTRTPEPGPPPEQTTPTEVLGLLALLMLTHSSDQVHGSMNDKDEIRGFPVCEPHPDLISTAVAVATNTAVRKEAQAASEQQHEKYAWDASRTKGALPLSTWLKATPFATRFHNLKVPLLDSTPAMRVSRAIHSSLGRGDFPSFGPDTPLSGIFEKMTATSGNFMIGYCTYDTEKILHGYETAVLDYVSDYYSHPHSRGTACDADSFARAHAHNKIPRFLLLRCGGVTPESVILLRIDTNEGACNRNENSEQAASITKDDLLHLQHTLMDEMKSFIGEKLLACATTRSTEEDTLDVLPSLRKKKVRRIEDDDDVHTCQQHEKPQWYVDIGTEMKRMDKLYPELAKKYGRA